MANHFEGLRDVGKEQQVTTPSTTTNIADAPPEPGITYTVPVVPKYTADDLEKAREQEREKLYSRLNKQNDKLKTVEQQLKQFAEERDARIAEAEAARETAEAEARRIREEEMSARELIDERDRTWQEKFDLLQRQQAEREAILEKEKQYAALQAYIQRRVNEERDDIAEELLDYIGVNVSTEEEAEASIQMAKAKSAQIWENISKLNGMRRGVGASGYTAGVIPSGNEPREITPDDIRNMSMEEFNAFRTQTGMDRANASRGLFG